MKSKKIMLVILVLIAFVIIYIAFTSNKVNYELHLPEFDKVVSITVEKNAKGTLISQTSKINNIIDIVKNIKKTNKGNSEDITKIENSIKVSFNYEESVATLLYVYTKNNKYYLEQPNNGLYEISKENYELINSYIE